MDKDGFCREPEPSEREKGKCFIDDAFNPRESKRDDPVHLISLDTVVNFMNIPKYRVAVQ
jgi:hypothetical protein